MPPLSQHTPTTYNFILVLEGVDALDPDVQDDLYEAKCDDATFGEREGVQFAEFDREAPSFSEAVISAIRSVEGAVPGLRVREVEPDDLVTQAVIAERVGRSRQSVSQLVNGTRGANDFPKPAGTIGRQTLWEWSEVSEWFERREGAQANLGGAPNFIKALNASLEARRQLWRLAELRREWAEEKVALSPKALDALPEIVDEGATEVRRELSAAGIS